MRERERFSVVVVYVFCVKGYLIFERVLEPFVCSCLRACVELIWLVGEYQSKKISFKTLFFSLHVYT